MLLSGFNLRSPPSVANRAIGCLGTYSDWTANHSLAGHTPKGELTKKHPVMSKIIPKRGGCPQKAASSNLLGQPLKMPEEVG